MMLLYTMEVIQGLHHLHLVLQSEEEGEERGVEGVVREGGLGKRYWRTKERQGMEMKKHYVYQGHWRGWELGLGRLVLLCLRSLK